MRRPLSLINTAALVVLIGGANAPAAARAQQPLTPVQVQAARLATANARADTLEEQARSMYSTPWLYVDAARLHRRAGLIRGNDSRAVASFRSAAWLYSVAGMHGVARTMMEEAAECAKAVGDVEMAANSYIDAAFLAIANGRDDQVPTILARAHGVLESPLLAAERRASILQRIGDSPRLAKLDSARKR